MTKKIIDYYKMLKIEKDADTEIIEEKCKKACKKYDEETYPKENKIINDAYIILTDDEKRAKYDKLLEKAYEEDEEEDKLDYDSKKSKRQGKRKYSQGRGKGMGRGLGKGMGRGSSKGLTNTFKYASNIQKNSGSFSKILKTAMGASRSSPLMSGFNLLVGGAAAGYGVKKGRDYMAKRAGRNK
ncbi:MAG: hypothetical protein BZ135_00395 [Methanosphaera sp. rholeuAM6]|nr:MAG: hypothetical protein BZ135_00395 [Methanosphaera sp. rholeuAM6]